MNQLNTNYFINKVESIFGKDAFDFFIQDKNIAIEFDGKQYFKVVEHWGGLDALIYVQKCDQIKNQYCIDNNIHLKRISYNDDIFEEMEVI